jgi:ligand-binding sensor domain-containing protein/signal transduction histidine kinase
MRLLSLDALRHRRFLSGFLLALCFCLRTVLPSLAVEKSVLPDVVLRNWDLDDGLPSARINAIARTSDGYLWLATQRGVVRFDGARFAIFDAANTPGMKDDRASCLLLDGHGDLWVGTASGTLLKRAGQIFRAQDLGAAAPYRPFDGSAAGKVNALAEDGQGAIWLAIEGMGLVRFLNGQATAFNTNSGLPSLDVRKILCDREGRLWAVADGQLGMFSQGRWQTPDSMPPASQGVRTISLARDGGLWVATGTVDPLATRDLRIYKLREGRWSAEAEPYPWPQDSQQFQRLALLEDEGGRLWCATAGGVFCHTPGASWERLFAVAPWIQVEVMCLAEGDNDLLWMGTRTTGLLQVQKRQVMSVPLPDVASQHAVLTVCASQDGNIWCGTDGAGIFRWHGGQMTQYGAESGLPSLHVAALLEDHQTNLWAGTDNGLFRRVGTKFEPVPGPAPLRGPILALLEDRQGNLWTGGPEGLVRLGATGATVFRAAPGLFGGAIRALAQDPQGRIWVGPNAGLYWLDGEEFKHCPVPQVPRLQGIFALHCDREGALWIGTDLAGLLRLQGGRFDQWISVRDGLPSNHLTAILEDDDGDLWFGSENGVFGCSKAALDAYQPGTSPLLQPRRLTVADGLAHKVCSGVGQPSACKSADGRLWFPDGPALAVFSPATIPRTSRVWSPLIDGAAVDGASVNLLPSGLRVPAGARRLELQFTSPNLLTPERLRFRFRLEGLDHAWVDAGPRREASYYRLPPGQYEFKVMVSGPEGIWQEGRGLPLQVLPYLWQRRSFQWAGGLALLVGVAGAAWGLERSRSRRRLDRLNFQRTLDAERQRIARDIHDDLGSGLTEIILMSDSLDGALPPTPGDQKLIAEISARARALTRAMDEVVWAINPRNDTLEGFLTYLGKFTQDYLGRAEIRCRWNVPLEVPDLPLSAECRHNLYLACKEAIHNVVKHAHASEVSIRFDWVDQGFSLTIEDDGKGFKLEVPMARGNGLSNMRQRLEQHHGECAIETAPNGGTRVRLSLPGVRTKTSPF